MMLEDGEIDEEDLEPQVREEDEEELEGDEGSKSNKRKGRDAKSNKRKKMPKNKHQKSKKSLEDGEAESGEENAPIQQNEESNEFKNDYDSRFDTSFKPPALMQQHLPTPPPQQQQQQPSLNHFLGDKDERDTWSSLTHEKKGQVSLKSLLKISPSSPGHSDSDTDSKNLSSSVWSTPLSKREKEQKTIPTSTKSLFDLFLNTSATVSSKVELDFVDPVITEKENKPKITKQPLMPGLSGKPLMQQMDFKRKSEEMSSGEKLISVESIQKKMEKKRKYVEMAKESAKRDEEKRLNPQPPVLCKFFAEGRCQKGDECTFNHNIQLMKKFEICKYYLNGFCSKGDKCLYMHSEFPCKFYHRKGAVQGKCMHGDKCRFSHEPITNPALAEALDKHLKETEDPSKRTSILGSPPRDLNPIATSSNGESIPSLMAISIGPTQKVEQSQNRPFFVKQEAKKMPLLSTPPPPIILNQPNQYHHHHLNQPMFQDIDERSLQSLGLGLGSTTLINTSIPPPTLRLPHKPESQDIDERSSYPNPNPNPSSTLTNEENTDGLKQQLIIKIMKAIADDDGGVFSQIPKQTLTELLVKLLNAKSDSSLNAESLLTLLNTLDNVKPAKVLAESSDEEKQLNINESNLEIDEKVGLKPKKRFDDGITSDYDDDEYEESRGLVIEGHVGGDFEYRLIPIDIEPSKLWSNPPPQPSFNDNIDQESDPRIKYYSNKANMSNLANFHLQLQQQQQQQSQTPASPTLNTCQQGSVSNSASSPLGPGESTSSKTKNRIVDPRLASRVNQTNSMSPTRPISPDKTQQQNDLLSIQSKITGASLLSTLPDLPLPNHSIYTQNKSTTAQQQQFTLTQQINDSNTVKLSIEDYKRKIQKPGSYSNLSQPSNCLNEYESASTANSQASNASTLPSIPSYSVNLQAPQSLHELLRNFQ